MRWNTSCRDSVYYSKCSECSSSPMLTDSHTVSFTLFMTILAWTSEDWQSNTGLRGVVFLTVGYYLIKVWRSSIGAICSTLEAKLTMVFIFFSTSSFCKHLTGLAQCRLGSPGTAKWKDGVMILNWSCLDSTQMQLSPSYLHFCHKPYSLFGKQILPSLPLCGMWFDIQTYNMKQSFHTALLVPSGKILH